MKRLLKVLSGLVTGHGNLEENKTTESRRSTKYDVGMIDCPYIAHFDSVTQPNNESYDDDAISS